MSVTGSLGSSTLFAVRARLSTKVSGKKQVSISGVVSSFTMLQSSRRAVSKDRAETLSINI